METIFSLLLILMALLTGFITLAKIHESEVNSSYPLGDDADSWQSWSYAFLVGVLLGLVWPIVWGMVLVGVVPGWLIAKFIVWRKNVG